LPRIGSDEVVMTSLPQELKITCDKAKKKSENLPVSIASIIKTLKGLLSTSHPKASF